LFVLDSTNKFDLSDLRQLFYCPSRRPFLVSGHLYARFFDHRLSEVSGGNLGKDGLVSDLLKEKVPLLSETIQLK